MKKSRTKVEKTIYMEHLIGQKFNGMISVTFLLLVCAVQTINAYFPGYVSHVHYITHGNSNSRSDVSSDWGRGADHVSVDFDDLATSRCHPNPCENNGFCHDTEEGFTCTCAHGYLGTKCQGE